MRNPIQKGGNNNQPAAPQRTSREEDEDQLESTQKSTHFYAPSPFATLLWIRVTTFVTNLQ